MSLPRFTTDDKNVTLLQSAWATQLEPVIEFSPNKGLILKGISLISGVNTINHRLGRKPQGYIITDMDAAATVYRSQPLNDLTLTLTSNAAANVAIWVF